MGCRYSMYHEFTFCGSTALDTLNTSACMLESIFLLIVPTSKRYSPFDPWYVYLFLYWSRMGFIGVWVPFPVSGWRQWITNRFNSVSFLSSDIHYHLYLSRSLNLALALLLSINIFRLMSYAFLWNTPLRRTSNIQTISLNLIFRNQARKHTRWNLQISTPP